MTQVKMLYEGNIFIGFKMEGHAGFNLKGPDILCASLSTASIMTINGVVDWTGIDVEEALICNDQKVGIIHFQIPWEMASPTTQQLFKSFEMFVKQLEEQYKGYVIIV